MLQCVCKISGTEPIFNWGTYKRGLDVRVGKEVWYLILKQNKCHPCEQVGGGGNAASLLSTKVADCMLAHSKKIESIYTCAPLSKLSNEEKA